MPNDQHSVRTDDDIWLDGIGALVDGQFVCRRRVFGGITARATVGDDDRGGRHPSRLTKGRRLGVDLNQEVGVVSDDRIEFASYG